MSIPDGVLKYQTLMRELDDKITQIQSRNPTRNSQDSKNLIKLKMIKKESENKYTKSMGGDLKSLFRR